MFEERKNEWLFVLNMVDLLYEVKLRNDIGFGVKSIVNNDNVG